MGRRKKKSDGNADIMRILSEEPVIIPQDRHQEETSLPSPSNPWPGWHFIIGLIVASWLFWSFAPDWFKHLLMAPFQQTDS